MTPPTIKHAEELCKRLGAVQVILVAFDADGEYAGASYGMSRELCREATRRLDCLFDSSLLLLDEEHADHVVDAQEGLP